MIIPAIHRIVVKQRNLTEISKEHKRMKELGWEIPETEDKRRAQAGVDQGTEVLGISRQRVQTMIDEIVSKLRRDPDAMEFLAGW